MTPRQRSRVPGAPATRRSSFRFKAEDIADDGTFTGYGSVWGVIDSYGDIMIPGSFAASLEQHAANGDMPKLLWQHLPEEPIGVWLEMREDERGLYAKGKLLQDVQRGREALTLLRAGALSGLSIGYEAVDIENATSDAVVQRYGYEVPTGGMWRLLHAVDLWELSVVTFPALSVAQVDSVRRREPVTRAPVRQPTAVRTVPRPAPDTSLDPIAAALRERGARLDRLR
jgi:uncharacterized protein